MTPIIILFAPIHKIFSSPITLLILQSLALSLGAIPVFLISQEVIKKPVLSFALVVSYLLYPPLQYSNLSDFHYMTPVTTFLLFGFYYLIKRRWFLFYLSLILSVSTKENIALITALIGIYMFLVLNERLKGFIIFVLSTFYFLAVIYLVFPKLGGGMGAFGRYEYLGRNVASIFMNIILHPINTLGILFMPPKIVYLLHIFASVGFFSFLSPSTLLLSVSEFSLNLLSSYNPQWQVKFHYTAAITQFVFISAIYGVAFLKRLSSKSKYFTTLLYSNVVDGILVVYLVSISILWNFLHSPSPIFYKFDWSVFQETADTVSARRVLEMIPGSASVSAMNNLGPHLSNRRFLFRFPIKYQESDYVVVDPSAVRKSFDLSQVAPEEFEVYLRRIGSSGRYQRVFANSRLLVFQKQKTK